MAHAGNAKKKKKIVDKAEKVVQYTDNSNDYCYLKIKTKHEYKIILRKGDCNYEEMGLYSMWLCL